MPPSIRSWGADSKRDSAANFSVTSCVKQYIARAAAGEVANAGDRAVARVFAYIDTCGLLATSNLPLVDVACGRVLPENVVCARASEITDASHRIAGRMKARADACHPLAVRPEFPG